MRGPDFYARKKGKRDENHAPIRDGLAALGHTVIDTAGVGDDVPDLCVYPRDRIFKRAVEPPVPIWLEVKTEDGEPTEGQLKWAAEAKRRGIRHAFVLTLDEALKALKC